MKGGKHEEIFNLLKKDFQSIEDVGFLRGLFGKLLYSFEYVKKNPESDKFTEFENQVTGTIDQLEKCRSIVFSDGLAGIGATLIHFKEEQLFDEEIDDYLKEFDEVILNSLSGFKNKNNYDYLHGLVGIGVYLLERGYHDVISKVLDDLHEDAISDSKGIRWISQVSGGGDKKKNVINISLAHGSAATIVFLARCVNKSQNYSGKAKEILEGAVRFTMSCRQQGEGSSFPGYVEINPTHNLKPVNSRLAWCYGDLGIGLALWQAAEALNSEDLKNDVLTIFLRTTKRKKMTENYKPDTGICHGTSGIAHIYNRMYWNTNNELFKEAANYWIAETQVMMESELKAVKKIDVSENEWNTHTGILEGIAGIGLVLYAHENNCPPSWDKLLLMS